MAHYKMEPSRETLHGVLSRDIPPALVIQPGDSVCFRTLEADWRLECPREPMTASGSFFPRKPDYDAGHALCGPVAIEGALPGMTLAVHINEVIPANWGWSRVGGGDTDHMKRIGFDGDEHFILWSIDVERGTAISHLGHSVPIRPFPGVMTTCPNSSEPIRTHLPGPHGANLDCKELVAGSTLYLPVYVEKALFSIGDGHAAQGDGESGCTAIECPMDKVDLSFTLIDDWQLDAPVCKTLSAWITFGFSENLTDAAYDALRRMVALMERLYDLPHKEALNLSSVLVDLRVTQIVNGIRGAHAVLRHGTLAL